MKILLFRVSSAQEWLKVGLLCDKIHKTLKSDSRFEAAIEIIAIGKQIIEFLLVESMYCIRIPIANLVAGWGRARLKMRRQPG